MHKTLFGGLAAVGIALLAGCSSLAGGDLVRPGEPTAVIEVVNGSSHMIDAVTVSACDNFTHGFNRLPEGYGIPPGGSYRFTVSAGCWDVDAGSFSGGEALERLQVPANSIYRYTVTN